MIRSWSAFIETLPSLGSSVSLESLTRTPREARMANDFCWFELVTTDTKAAEAF